MEFSKEILNSILKAKKDLVLTAGNATYTLDKKGIAELLERTGDHAVVTLGTTASADVKDAVTDVYTIGLSSGTATQKVKITNFGEKIEVGIQLDASTPKKLKKVEVLNLDTNQSHKAKVNKNEAQYEIKAAGSYVVVQK